MKSLPFYPPEAWKGEEGYCHNKKKYLSKQPPIACMSASKAGNIDM